VISLATHLDETASGAGWILPAHHALEAWGDIEVRSSWRALAQPAMQPLFDTRQAEDILLAMSPEGSETGLPGDFKTFLEDSWRALQPAGSGPFERWWRGVVQAGGAQPAQAADRLSGQAIAADAAPELREAATNYRFAALSPSEGTQLVVSPTVQMYDGRGANRSWMQELPDPVTRVVWNSWVEMHPDTAQELGVRTGDVVEVSSASGSVQASVYTYRGIRPDTVSIPLGQGHTAYGRYAAGRGVNALDLLAADVDERSGALAFAGTSVEIRATGERSPLAVMQGGDTDLGREIAEIVGVAEARAAIREHHVDLSELVKEAYDSDPKSPYRWGMSVDLNACTGCGACVTACYAENNVPVVGETLCAQGREMSWMQIERFYEETNDGDFQTVYQPVMCQQCGDAPCEPVCPVYAAYHTPEGLNGQIYNRCVGTRYCANNCPYKVRRFNWYTYEFPYPLNLQLNPDVTVRETGVMEKCSFCVQRINRAKIEAKREGRLVADGEVVTACMQTCPTHAITFGNLKDPESAVSRKAKSALSYHVLDELNTRPGVTYQPKVTHAEVAAGGHGGEAGH
ncbi:MAG: molybdopterin dinucleotide binding domain-containing protein, partial [Gemmatimonadota bacterium]